MERDYKQEARYKAAQKRVKDIKGFYGHLVAYVLINAMIILFLSDFDLSNGLHIELSGYHTALFWGMGLLAHGLSVFGSGLFLGKRWEDRKIKELMDKEEEQKQQRWK